MGLFDYIIAPFVCPYCQHEEKEHDWQTKSLQCLMKTYKVGEEVILEDLWKKLVVKEGYFQIYTLCKNCKRFVKGFIKIENSRITENIEYERS